MATLLIRLLGGLRIERDGTTVELGSQRARGLVAYLLVHRDRPHSRAHLAYVLWPESDEAQARTNLRKTLHQLRRTLPEAEGLVALDAQALTWRPEAELELDVARFDEAVECAQRAEASSELDLEREHLEDAAQLYRGELLPELYDDWLETERERLHQRFGHVLERLVDVLWLQRDDRAAVDYAQRLVQHDPLVESSYRRLMRLHARSGERAKGLHVYHSCASTLQEQLRIGPSQETVALYEDVLRLGSEGGTPAADAPSEPSPALITEAPLVGRRTELDQLRAVWDQAHSGRPGLVLVTGDSGIGKTRLVEEFTGAILRREAAVIATRCYATERALAFTPLIALMRTPIVRNALHDLEPVWRREVSRLLPELEDEATRAPVPLTEGWQRQRLFEALAHAVLATQPLVAFIDDVQWCDGDSLDWLHYLLRSGSCARLMLVAAARTHELDADARFGGLLEELDRDGLLTRIELQPLSEADTINLARSLCQREPEPEALAALVTETEGNPLFVVEMVREGTLATSPAAIAGEGRPATALPRRLRAVIASRLERLSTPTSELLGMAAVIGREFDFELLVRVSRQGEDVVVTSLDELWRRRIVRELRAGRYDFSHDKLREVAYGALSLTRRRLLHRYTAEALEELDVGEREGVHAQIAFHYDRAGYAERAVAHYQHAAETARSLYAHEEARLSYQRGLQLVDEVPPTAVLANWRRAAAGELEEGLGDVLGLKGLHEEARERFERALEHRSSCPIDCARLWRKIGLAWTARYRFDEAAQAYSSAEAALDSAEAPADADYWRELIDIRLERSMLSYWRLDWRECGRVLESLEGAALHHATALQRGRYFNALASKHFNQGRWTMATEGVEYMRSALAGAEDSGSVTDIAAARFALGFAHLWHGDLRPAEEQLEAALLMSESMGNSVLRARILTYLCFLHRRRGDAAATQRYARLSLAAASELAMPEYVGAAHGHLAWLAYRREDHGACLREASAALRSWETGQPYTLQWCARLPLLAVFLTQDRLSDAVSHAAAMLEPSQQRLPAGLTEALEGAVGVEADPNAAQSALLRAVALAVEARLM